MKNLKALAAVIIAALAIAAIWLAGTSEQGQDAANDRDEPASAYDYEASDVVVRQMGADGKLQYQVDARQVTQLPKDGQITAHQLVMHQDPVADTPDAAHRWTLTADQADLPEAGGVITLLGNVRASGVSGPANTPVSLATEQLSYDLASQDLASDQMVLMKRGRATLRGRGLRANIKRETYALESQVNVTLAP